MGNMKMALDADGGVWGLTSGGFQWLFLLIHLTHPCQVKNHRARALGKQRGIRVRVMPRRSQ